MSQLTFSEYMENFARSLITTEPEDEAAAIDENLADLPLGAGGEMLHEILRRLSPPKS